MKQLLCEIDILIDIPRHSRGVSITSPEIGPQTGFKAKGQGFLACGVFLARGAEFSKSTTPYYALVKPEPTKVQK